MSMQMSALCARGLDKQELEVVFARVDESKG